MIIVGAGLAGLLAAAMLRNEATRIIERQSTLPNNHSAVLRFRTSVVGDVLNIPFKKVQILKGVARSIGNPIADALAYSRKTNGSFTLRSLVNARGEIEERYIAPPDLIQQIANRLMCPILHDCEFKEEHWGGDVPVISTIPMPVLMGLLGWRDVPEFRSVPGFNISFEAADTNAYVSLYVPDPDLSPSRISITGNLVQIEITDPFDEFTEWETNKEFHEAVIAGACRLLGHIPFPDLWNVRRQQYAKILPTDENVRKRFILWASEKYNIYSLGRYATWRPGLLLDDLVNDVRVIQKLQRSGSYDHRK